MDGAGVPSPGARRPLAFGSFALQGENYHSECIFNVRKPSKYNELVTRSSDITATYVTINQKESENVHRLARFNCETISYGSLEFVWTEAFPCFWHSNLDKEHITEAGIDLFSNNICPGFSQGQKKAFLSVHLFQNCRVESTIISTTITYTHIMTMINVRSPGRPSLPTSSSEAGLTQRDYLAIGLCAGSHHHHHHPPSQHDHRQASWCCSTCSRWSCWSWWRGSRSATVFSGSSSSTCRCQRSVEMMIIVVIRITMIIDF